MEELLFENLRIDEEDVKRMKSEEIAELSPLYHSTNVSKLAALTRKIKNERRNLRDDDPI